MNLLQNIWVGYRGFILVFVAAFVLGFFSANGCKSDEKPKLDAGVVNPASPASFIPLPEPHPADTSSKVRFIYIDKPGDAYPVYMDKAVLPDVWLESDTCIAKQGLCIAAKFNPAFNAWKFKVWQTELNITHTEFKPVITQGAICPPVKEPATGAGFALDLGYTRFWESNAVGSGLVWQYGFVPGWNVYAEGRLLYNINEAKLIPHIGAGISLKIK